MNLLTMHNQKIVHFDIKPDNILTLDDKFMLTDFGESENMNKNKLNLLNFNVLRNKQAVYYQDQSVYKNDVQRQINNHFNFEPFHKYHPQLVPLVSLHLSTIYNT